MSQEFDTNVLNFVKQKGYYLYEYMSDFEKFTEELLSKEKFYSLMTGKKLLINCMNRFIKFGIHFKKWWKIILHYRIIKNDRLCMSHYLRAQA